jgi:hypothetical protein
MRRLEGVGYHDILDIIRMERLSDVIYGMKHVCYYHANIKIHWLHNMSMEYAVTYPLLKSLRSLNNHT